MAAQSLQGKVVVVGAGAKNLGGLISREFAKGGAKIVVHYNSSSTKPDAESTVKAIQSIGGEAYATQGDLTKPAHVAAQRCSKKPRSGLAVSILP